MHSLIFGIKPDDDLDEIFNFDATNSQPIRSCTTVANYQEVASEGIGTRWSFETAVQTPKFSSHFVKHGLSCDSAIGSVSPMPKVNTVSNQISSNLFNTMTNENGESQASSVQLPVDHVQDTFLSTQAEIRFRDLVSSSYGCLTQSNLSDLHPLSGSFVNRVNSFDSQHSPSQSNPMSGNFDQPYSSFQQAMLTPFFENASIPADSQSNNHFSFDNLSQETSNSTSDSLVGFSQRFKDSQHDALSQYATSNDLHGFHRRFIEDNMIANASSLPKSIRDLYTQIKNYNLSDWSFVYALSAQTCQEFLPINYSVTLKTSLLLSIASIDTKSDMAPIPIMAFGQDSSSANAIMNYMGNLAQRFLAPTDYTFNVTLNSNKIVEIGPVFLAKNGVCYLGDWSGLSKKLSDEIKILIDSGRYFFNETGESFPLGSALWTYWSFTQKNKKEFTNASVFLQYFGIPIMTDTNEPGDIIDFLLTEARDGKVDVNIYPVNFEINDDDLNITIEDMKDYLNTVRKVNVRMTEEAEKLLKLYSVTIQKDRHGLLSPRCLQIIQQMAESFAKLSLRNEVLVCDVVSAISIAEKTFFAITGISRAPLLSSTRDIRQVDEYIQVLHQWIFTYVGILQ